MFKRRIYLLIIFGLFCLCHASAQFYNGHKMTFGKNRVQYNDFFWSFYRFDRFDTYFNQDGKELAQYTAEIAEKELLRIESIFDYTLDKRLIFIVFNKLSDFRQSNIGLISGSDENNIGGVTQIINNKVFMYYEGNHKDYRVQISSAITKVIINEMLYGSSVKNNVANSTLINLPEWYVKGLCSYMSNSWDVEIEGQFRDRIINGDFNKINRLTGEDAEIAGHSFWKYIVTTYGESVLPNIIYLTKINKNANVGFLYVLGKSLKEISLDWLGYYLYDYQEEVDTRTIPDDDILKTRKKLNYYQIKANPKSNKLAYVTNKQGKYKIWIYDFDKEKKIKVISKEHNLEQIQDYTNPVLAWHPSGKILSFITEEEGRLVLYYYTLETKDLRSRYLLYFDKILDFSYSHDATRFVFSAVKNSKTDIYVHTLSSSTNQQITNDLADDLYPRFINNSNQIIFCSNRKNEDVNGANEIEDLSDFYELYISDYKKWSSPLIKLSDNDFSNKTQVYDAGNNEFVYLSDENGVVNRYFGSFDSVISHIDTTIHYRQVFNSSPITDYSYNISEQDYNKNTNQSIEKIYKDGKFHFFKQELVFDIEKRKNKPTKFRTQLIKNNKEQDSINNIKKRLVVFNDIGRKDVYIEEIGDTISIYQDEVDINNYQFEKEKLAEYNEMYKDKNVEFVLDTLPETYPKIRIYETSFYNNYLVSQIDYSFLDVSYQMFTGGSVYFNPGMNGLIKLGANDLFEDYRIVGGVRLSANLESNEYLLSFENLKKQLDKEYIFHRQTFVSQGLNSDNVLKAKTHEGIYILKYPFSQVSSLRLRTSFRHDRLVNLSNSDASLVEPDIIKLWLGLKLEYVFDNTRSLGKNLYSGTRFKVFGEAYQQIDKPHDNLYVIGADFRNYINIHRNLVWANRIAASGSVGSAKLIYYLGGVDNWMASESRKFDTLIRVDYTQNYTYQAVATNLRGFSQNIRNGSNFVVFNSELRWPVFSYFANYPISSTFLSNFQIVSFFDLGSAWTGFSPFSGKNSWDFDDYQYGNVRVIVDSNKYPFVAGYGFGARVMLFGYFIRLDWARGIENGVILPRKFYLSLSLDF